MSKVYDIYGELSLPHEVRSEVRIISHRYQHFIPESGVRFMILKRNLLYTWPMPGRPIIILWA